MADGTLPSVVWISNHQWHWSRGAALCVRSGKREPIAGCQPIAYKARPSGNFHLSTQVLGFTEITGVNEKRYLWQHSFRMQEGDRSDANGRSPLMVRIGGACQVSWARTRAQSWVPGLHCLVLLSSSVSSSWGRLTDLKSGALLGAKQNNIQHWEGAVRVEGAPMPSQCIAHSSRA